jgi:hypothetical protein
LRWLAPALVLAAPGLTGAQDRLVTAYYQNVPLWSDESPLAPGGWGDFNRFRVMAAPAFGAFSVEIAYEQLLTLRENEAPAGIFVGSVPGGGEWLPLQWTLEESEHVLWRHRFDRLKLGFSPSPSFEIDVGRQAVSWATTLFLTPADPFAPFDPADPFREFRAGVDAFRARIYPGPLSEIDFVVRPTESEEGEEMTALGRALTTFRGWELSGWVGVLYDGAAGAFAGSGSIGGFALRGEGELREENGGTVFRGSVGVDRRFGIAGRDLLFVVEYQRDGLGAAGPEDYKEVLTSDPFLRGELQVLGRNETAVQASYQVHPLLRLAGFALVNLDDGSALFSPSFAFSASDEATVSGGVFFGVGESALSGDGTPLSEYGLVPAAAYFSVSWFF